MKREMQWVISILVITSIGLLAGLVYMLWGQTDRPSVGANSFEECVGAGNPIMETHPRRCNDVRTGEVFTEEVTEPSEAKLTSRDYQSAGGVAITVDDWADNRQVSSPLIITGSVPGSWSFEGSFPIEIVYEEDTVMPGTTARLQGDWMTDEMVPFRAELTLDERLVGKDVMIVLRKANPSGLSGSDDALSLNVQVTED